LAGGESTAESQKRSSRLQKCSPADTKIRKFFIVRPPCAGLAHGSARTPDRVIRGEKAAFHPRSFSGQYGK
jgi:hypothetical protein